MRSDRRPRLALVALAIGWSGTTFAAELPSLPDPIKWERFEAADKKPR